MQLNINNIDKTSFGLTNNKAAARKALKNVPERSRKEIYRAIDQFCNMTQERGIKGELKLESPTRFGIKPVQTGVWTYHNRPVLHLNAFISALNLEKLDHSRPFGNEFAKHRFVRVVSNK
ncbi:hypothetical protein J6S88_01295 [bacterium]|nr:hypothetical protein [bacterium]